MDIRYTMLGSAAAIALLIGGHADASVTLPTFERSDPIRGNACSGVLGTAPNCELDGSPLIVKFDFNDAGEVTETTIGSFPTIDGNEFSFDFGTDGNTGTGTWFYEPDGPEDPVITGFAVKGGPNFVTYTREQPVIVFAAMNDSADFVNAPPGSGNGVAGLSNISFYDTAVVPVPAALPLLATAVAGLAVWRRRRQA